MQKRNLYTILGVVVLVFVVLFAKNFYNPSEAPKTNYPPLHVKNLDYRAEINLAMKNKQPLFIEFYGDY